MVTYLISTGSKQNLFWGRITVNRFNPVDEEEELYSVPWGKENYIQQYPKLHRPSDKLVQREF